MSLARGTDPIPAVTMTVVIDCPAMVAVAVVAVVGTLVTVVGVPGLDGRGVARRTRVVHIRLNFLNMIASRAAA